MMVILINTSKQGRGARPEETPILAAAAAVEERRVDGREGDKWNDNGRRLRF